VAHSNRRKTRPQKPLKKNLKKFKKKLATTLAVHLKPDAQGQIGAFKRSKKN
jgi:hypothetical protein